MLVVCSIGHRPGGLTGDADVLRPHVQHSVAAHADGAQL